jgi:hypothetical protein
MTKSWNAQAKLTKQHSQQSFSSDIIPFASKPLPCKSVRYFSVELKDGKVLEAVKKQASKRNFHSLASLWWDLYKRERERCEGVCSHHSLRSCSLTSLQDTGSFMRPWSMGRTWTGTRVPSGQSPPQDYLVLLVSSALVALFQISLSSSFW